MTPQAFTDWCFNAKPLDRVVYFTGGWLNPTGYDEGVDRIALQCAQKGLVTLVQRRNGNKLEYMAERLFPHQRDEMIRAMMRKDAACGYGTSSAPTRWTPARLEILREMKSAGRSVLEMAQALGVSEHAIVSKLPKEEAV